MGETPRHQEDYRDNLAEEIKETPKEERREVLGKAKETPEYWVARNKKIRERQNEEPINDGMGVFVKNKTLYHGSRAASIEKFKGADETTVGDGLYCTSQPQDAINYAHHRSSSGNPPVLYEVSVENLKLLDLRNDENVKKVTQGFKPVLKNKIDAYLEKYEGKTMPYNIVGYKQALQRAVSAIDSKTMGLAEIQDVTLHLESGLFNKYVESLGYNGLITIEGGEGDFRKNHDSYVIFDPEKAKITKEQELEKKP